MRVVRWATVALLVGTLAAHADNTGTDPAHKYAWGENVGWANAGPTNHEVTVHYYEETGGWLSGHAWGENIGWIVMVSPVYNQPTGFILPDRDIGAICHQYARYPDHRQ